MCGIFGIVCGQNSSLAQKEAITLLPVMFELAEKRGREASGLAIASENQVYVHKSAGSARTMLRSAAYQRFIGKTTGESGNEKHSKIAVIGHSRLVTNGGKGFAENNQPVIVDSCVGVHNGIIVNYSEIMKKYHIDSGNSDLDSRIIFELIGQYLEGGLDVAEAVTATFRELEGEANIALFATTAAALLLATNTGSIYIAHNGAAQVFLFASEKSFLDTTLAKDPLRIFRAGFKSFKIEPQTGISVILETAGFNNLTLSELDSNDHERELPRAYTPDSSGKLKVIATDLSSKTIHRCKKCILPASFPLISFDEQGICNYCREYKPQKLMGTDALKELAQRYRSKSGQPDCIVALSGGRDSCYGLHFIKKELGLNPIAFTYDWGMVTDLARRNQSRMCAKLGVEHIIRSPDIAQKRRNIRKNLEAWLKRPDIGVMLPLLTAGDKQFYHYPRQLRKEYGVEPVFFCGGGELERTVFKTAFCGIDGDQHGQILWKFPWRHKAQLAVYFIRQFALNPRYLNSSLLDTIWAYFATYIQRDDYLYLYHFIQWDEHKIMSVLREEYNWEAADDTQSTWRIGDGTAAFYNYVYHTVAGFSEHDTFRSNQVRAGLINREEALRLCDIENQPRFDSMKEYASLVGFNLEEALMVINSIPKIYDNPEMFQ